MKKNYVSLLAATAFANAPAPAPAAPVQAPATPAAGVNSGTAAKPAATKKAGAPKAEDRVVPAFTPIAADIPIPANASKRGGAKSVIAVELEKLEVGQSIGIINKTKVQISSQVSKLNNHKDNLRPAMNPDGTPKMKQGDEIKDQNGIVVGRGQPTQEMEKVKLFEAFEVDPRKDRDKAKVRIFRTK